MRSSQSYAFHSDLTFDAESVSLLSEIDLMTIRSFLVTTSLYLRLCFRIKRYFNDYPKLIVCYHNHLFQYLLKYYFCFDLVISKLHHESRCTLFILRSSSLYPLQFEFNYHLKLIG